MTCPKDKILNPNTGRCVLKSGKIGKKLLQNKKGGYKSSSNIDGNVKSEKTEKLEKEVKSLKQAYENALRNLQKCNANFYDLKQKYEISMHKSAHSHKQDHHSERKKASTTTGKEKHQKRYKKETEKLVAVGNQLKKNLTQLTSLKQNQAAVVAEMHKFNTLVKEKEAESERAHDKYVNMLQTLKDSTNAANKKPDAQLDKNRLVQQVAINDAQRRIPILKKRLQKLREKSESVSDELKDAYRAEITLQSMIENVEASIKSATNEVEKYRSLYTKQSKVVDELIAKMSR